MSDQHYDRHRTEPIEPLLTVGDVGDVLRVSRATVYRLKDRGDLHPITIGGSTRFRPDDVRELIDRDRKAAP